MKIIGSLCVLLIAVLSSRAAGDVELFVASIQFTNAECVITNSTDKEIYIFPMCLVDRPSFVYSNSVFCETNWTCDGPVNIGQWRDMIPLVPNSSIRFVVSHPSNQSWRVRAGIYRRYFHFKDILTPGIITPQITSEDKYEISSEVIQPKTHL
jgi:hypothetical protein